jgi:hypothetical protein
MSKAIALLIAIAGAISTFWGFISDKPLVPSLSIWLKSEGMDGLVTHIVFGVILLLASVLIWRYSNRPKLKPLIVDRLKDCQDCWHLKIENPNKENSAEKLDVKLVSISPLPKWPEYPHKDLPITFPIKLYPKEIGGDLVHAGDYSLFKIFKLLHYSKTEDTFWAGIGFELPTDQLNRIFEYNYLRAVDLREMGMAAQITEYRFKFSVAANLISAKQHEFLVTIKSDLPQGKSESIVWEKLK